MSAIATEFASTLATVQRPGDFCTVGKAEVMMPRLLVEGVGTIALPVLPVQAEQLIAIAERAPYGRGEATLTDTAVRRTWQIPPERIQIQGRHWGETFSAILVRAAEGLGVTDPIDASLYKMLIYDEGSFFVRHRDTEKEAGMFATLIVVLPSLSEGGELIVRHKDREERLDLRVHDPAEIAYAAFYADCVHEVLPVTAGYRLALVYNLTRRGRGQRPEPPDHAPQQTAVTTLLSAWAASLRAADDDDPRKLVYPLEHAYTPAELGFEALKGADAGVAKVVAAAARDASCDVHLALVTINESGSADYSGNYGRRRSWSRNDDEDEDEFEAGEVEDRTVRASNWRRPDGEPSLLTDIPVEEDEFSPPIDFETLEPDEEHFHEATGNAGATFERTYSRAALVLWPRDQLFSVINQAGPHVTIPFLADLAARWAASGDGPDSPVWREAHALSGHMLSTWREQHWHPSRDSEQTDLGKILDSLTRLRDAVRVEAVLALAAGRDWFNAGDSASVAAALPLLPAAKAAAALKAIVVAASGRTPGSCGTLLARVVAIDPAIANDAAVRLVAALPREPGPDRWDRGPGVGSGLVVDLMTALPKVSAALADRAADTMLAAPGVYGFDSVLIPAMRVLIERPKTAASQRLRTDCAAFLDARVALPLTPPPDWTRASAVGCSCGDCTALSRFLADPAQPKWVFRAAETARGHVESTIRTARCDVDTITERKGRPYSLICTKNRASHERLVAQRKEDLRDLGMLRKS